MSGRPPDDPLNLRDGVAAQVLHRLDVDTGQARTRTLARLSGK